MGSYLSISRYLFFIFFFYTTRVISLRYLVNNLNIFFSLKLFIAMSKQTGIIKLKGTIGGVTFYKSEGQDLARMAHGPDKERIDTDPAFQRTRENNAEFGGSATAAKALRTAFASSLHTMADSRFVSRLTRIFKQINANGTGTRGQRPITISANRSMLMNIDFNKKTIFSSIFSAPFTATHAASRNSVSVEIPDFDPGVYISAPAGATHFRIIVAIGSISDFTYNVSTGHYEPTQPALNSLGSVGYSDYTLLHSTTPVTFDATVTIPGTPAMTDDVSVCACIGIEFYQQIAGAYYVLAQGNAMKIVDVF